MENCGRFVFLITFFLPKTTGTASHVTSFPWSIALDHTFYGFTGEITYAGY